MNDQQSTSGNAASVTASSVAALADAVDLSLSAARIAVVQPILASWLKDSAALNRLMQAEAHREVAPITVLRHGAHDAGSPA